MGRHKHTTVFTAIESELDNGEAAIAKAKKEHFKNYKAAWRKAFRSQHKQYTLSFTPEEARELTKEAKKAKRSRTAFIKAAYFAYIDKVYLIADPNLLLEIRQQLGLTYHALTLLIEKNMIANDLGTTLLHQFSDFEQKLLSKLHSPKSLEDWILETVRNKPSYRKTILSLLKSVDNGD